MDLVIFLPLLIVLGAFMYFASRRQKKAMQATIDLHNSLQVGDRVHTTAGLQATITGITDDTVDLEIAPGVVTTWMKLAIRDVIEPDDEIEADDEVDEDLDEIDEIDEDIDETREPSSNATEITETTNTADASSDPNRLTKD